jgi:hypothetical protein
MKITLPTTPTKLQDLMKKYNPYGEVLYIQAASTNTVNVLFGPRDCVELEVEPGLSATYPAVSLSSVWVYATAASQVATFVFNKS